MGGFFKKISDKFQGGLDSLSGKKAGREGSRKFGEFRGKLLADLESQISAIDDDPLLGLAQGSVFKRAPKIVEQLRGEILGTASAGVLGGQVAGIEQARLAGGGRGGLAFGGGTTRLAAAGGRAASAGQSSAMFQALAAASGQDLSNIDRQSAFAFNRRAPGAQMRQQLLAGLASIASGATQGAIQGRVVGSQNFAMLSNTALNNLTKKG